VIGDTPSTWNAAFAGTNIHGVFLLASDTTANIDSELVNIQSILGSSITEMLAILTSSPSLALTDFAAIV
jgi:hypothetical protein